MQQLYHVKGTLSKGFVGQISYTICLEEEYKNLDIHFTFDKQRNTEATDELIQMIKRTCREKYGIEDYPTEDCIDLIFGEHKTEIHTMATLNDEFIGCIHRQSLDRHMLYKDNEATAGCIPQESFSGVLKVTVLVFNVVLDETHYPLTVSAE